MKSLWDQQLKKLLIPLKTTVSQICQCSGSHLEKNGEQLVANGNCNEKCAIALIYLGIAMTSFEPVVAS